MATTDSDSQINEASFQNQLNNAFDKVWSTLGTNQLLDPLPMGLDITDGGIRMWGGEISGFSRLHRIGDVSQHLDGNIWNVQCDLEVNNLKAWSNAKKTALGVGLGKSSDVAIDYVKAGIVVNIPTSDGPGVIKECIVKKVDNVKVTQTHGFLVQSASIKVAQEVLDKHLQEIIDAIKESMMKALNEILAKLGRPKEYQPILDYVLSKA